MRKQLKTQSERHLKKITDPYCSKVSVMKGKERLGIFWGFFFDSTLVNGFEGVSHWICIFLTMSDVEHLLNFH